jgi:Tfp pilus assembly PilM family ATPase
MAISLRKDAGKGTVGLDIDGGFLAAVEASQGKIERAASAELTPGVMADGEVGDGDALSSALKDFFKRNSFSRTVRLGVSNQQIVVRQIELPKIEEREDREAAVRFQAEEAIAMPLDEAVLDHHFTGYSKSSDGVDLMQVIVVAARRSMVSQLTEAARSAGLRPEGIDLNAFALIRALDDGNASDGVARVHCHLAGVTNLAVAVGSACLFTRALSAPWASTNVEAAAGTLTDEIRLSIDYYTAQPGALEVAEVILSGPGSQREPLVQALEERMGRPTRVAPPAKGLNGSQVGEGEDPHRFTVAAGLAMGAYE